jgi:hypothetical protein
MQRAIERVQARNAASCMGCMGSPWVPTGTMHSPAVATAGPDRIGCLRLRTSGRPLPPSMPMHACMQRFAAVIMRIREPKTTALIFASGKMVGGGQRAFAPSPEARGLWHRISLFLSAGSLQAFSRLSLSCSYYLVLTQPLSCSPSHSHFLAHTLSARAPQVCTGAKSEDDSRTASRKYAKIVQKLGFAATFKEFKIQNIVGSCDVKFPIRLEGLAFSAAMFSSVSGRRERSGDEE